MRDFPQVSALPSNALTTAAPPVSAPATKRAYLLDTGGTAKDAKNEAAPASEKFGADKICYLLDRSTERKRVLGHNCLHDALAGQLWVRVCDAGQHLLLDAQLDQLAASAPAPDVTQGFFVPTAVMAQVVHGLRVICDALVTRIVFSVPASCCSLACFFQRHLFDFKSIPLGFSKQTLPTRFHCSNRFRPLVSHSLHAALSLLMPSKSRIALTGTTYHWPRLRTGKSISPRRSISYARVCPTP
jgi:hypothetical protein